MQKPVFTFEPLSGRHLRADAAFRIAFWLFIVLLGVCMMFLVPHYGSSGDELSRHAYGTAVLEYFTGLKHNPDYILPASNPVQPYGALFDGTAALLVHYLKPKDEYLLRHYWNALFGLGGILLAGLCGRQITGTWRTALFAALFLTLTPRYFGDAFNNPKDVPFAATALLFLYAFLRWLALLPHLRWKATLFLGLAMMLSLSIRPGGFLFVFYFGIFTIAVFFLRGDIQLKKLLPHALVALIVGYFGCSLIWPYAALNPLINPFLFFKS